MADLWSSSPVSEGGTASGGYFAIYNATATEVNGLTTEITTARGGQSSLIANLNLKATIAYVDSQIATGGVDLTTFSEPNDIITSSQDGTEFSSQPNATMEIHKQFYFDGGIQ